MPKRSNFLAELDEKLSELVSSESAALQPHISASAATPKSPPQQQPEQPHTPQQRSFTSELDERTKEALELAEDIFGPLCMRAPEII